MLPGRAVDHLYAANTRRSQQTAVSVANQFKLPINLLGGDDWGDFASRLRRELQPAAQSCQRIGHRRIIAPAVVAGAMMRRRA